MRTSTVRIAAARIATLSLGLTLVGCAMVSEHVLGSDTRSRPDVCLVVSPIALPFTTIESALDAALRRVAKDGGAVKVILANGRSAASFPEVILSSDANGGVFASDARNSGARAADAAPWADAAFTESLDAVASAEVSPDEVDLIGALQQCATRLGTNARSPEIVVITNGLHRTSDLDVADGATSEELADAVAVAVPAEFALHIDGLGEFDPEATRGPVKTDVSVAIRNAWFLACERLGDDRCSINP
jgi:hypothetical protein